MEKKHDKGTKTLKRAFSSFTGSKYKIEIDVINNNSFVMKTIHRLADCYFFPPIMLVFWLIEEILHFLGKQYPGGFKIKVFNKTETGSWLPIYEEKVPAEEILEWPFQKFIYQVKKNEKTEKLDELAEKLMSGEIKLSKSTI